MSKFQRKPIKLTWPEDHDLHGLEVLLRRPTIAQVDRVEAGVKRAEGSDRDAETISDLIRETAGAALISWNYCDESGADVPATADGILSIDIEAQLAILYGWVEKAVGVPKDLGKESASGQPPPGETFVMPVTGTPGLSDALASLHGLNAISASSNASQATP